MPRNFLNFVRLSIGTFILAIALRTFLVMGLIEPVLVAGSSMAPTFRGPHCSAVCPSCKQLVYVAAEFIPADGMVRCPHCATAEIGLLGKPVLRGDSLVVDRTAFHWRSPWRWEPIVFYSPQEGGGLCVKRVVGLPGETVELRGGDLWVDGRVVVKSLAEQRMLRQRVHREGDGPVRWQMEKEAQSPWVASPGLARRFYYYHPSGRPIADGMAYNASLSRRLNPMVDLMLSVRVVNLDDGKLVVEVEGHGPMLSVRLDGGQRLAEIWSEQRQVQSVAWSARRRKRLGENFLLEVSTFDRQLLVAIDGEALLRYPLEGDRLPEPTAQPFAIRAAAEVSLLKRTLWRDIYFTHAPVGVAPSGLPTRQKIGVDEFFVLGDNPSISLDSRCWGPVPRHRLLGKPLGGR